MEVECSQIENPARRNIEGECSTEVGANVCKQIDEEYKAAKQEQEYEALACRPHTEDDEHANQIKLEALHNEEILFNEELI